MLQVKAMQSFILLMNELDGDGGGEDVVGGVMGCVGQLMEQPREKRSRGAPAHSTPPPPAKSAMVALSAVATFTQLTSILFDRASEEVLNRESFVGNNDDKEKKGERSRGVKTTLEVLDRLCDMGESKPRAPR